MALSNQSSGPQPGRFSAASCSESLEGSPRRVPTLCPKPILEDLRAQRRQSCTRAPDGKVVLGSPEPAAPLRSSRHHPLGPADAAPAPALTPSSPRAVSAPQDRAPALAHPGCPGTRTQRQEPPSSALLTLRALRWKCIPFPAARRDRNRAGWFCAPDAAEDADEAGGRGGGMPLPSMERCPVGCFSVGSSAFHFSAPGMSW